MDLALIIFFSELILDLDIRGAKSRYLSRLESLETPPSVVLKSGSPPPVVVEV